MKKIFLTLLFVAIVSLQNFCGAAEIESAAHERYPNVVYPVVHTGDAAVDKKINREIFIELDRFLTAAHNDAMHNGRRVADVRMNYTVGANGDGNTVILSLILDKSYYVSGAAHPQSLRNALNFNMSSGELMGWDYLLDVGDGVSEENFKRRIEKNLVEHCAREGITLFEDALPLKNLPQDFYWDKNLNVHVIFNHYDIAPYAAGIIDVTLSQ